MSEGNHKPRIVRPGQVHVDICQFPGMLAYPISLTLQQGEAVKISSWGGLTKLEFIAAHIAAGIAYTGDPQPAAQIAQRAVDVARAVLDECNRRIDTEGADHE